MLQRLAARRGDTDGGYMLVEMLVVIVLMGVVGGLIGDAVITSLRGQRDISARASDLDSLRQAMERTTRDMRSADAVRCAQSGLLTLEVPTPTGATNTITWATVTTPAGSSVQEWTSPTNASPCAVPTGPSVTVLSNLDPAGAVFTYTAKTGYQPVTTGAVDPLSCAITAAPGTYEVRCVNGVDIDLSALLPGHPDLELTETVQLRNVP